MSSSDSDDSDGVASAIDFGNIDRVRQSVSFSDKVEMLAINDYQGMFFLFFFEKKKINHKSFIFLRLTIGSFFNFSTTSGCQVIPAPQDGDFEEEQSLILE